MTQRWNDLLFAHWPIPAAQMEALLPDWLEADTFQGSAWLGAVPFWLDRIKIRGVPPIPGARSFPDLNLRTYVRDRFTGTPGVYCFSVDSSNLLAVAVARVYYHLPYYWSEMRLEQRSEREFAFYSRRRFSSQQVIFNARYRGLGPSAKLAEHRGGTLEYFLTERPCLFSSNRAGAADPRQSALCSLAAGRSRGGNRAQRSGSLDGFNPAERRPDTALLAPPGGLCLAGGTGASGARGASGDGGSVAIGVGEAGARDPVTSGPWSVVRRTLVLPRGIGAVGASLFPSSPQYRSLEGSSPVSAGC